MIVRVAPRPGSLLRCAFCHAGVDLLGKPCATCATWLHEECWALAGRCPTLACLRGRIRIFSNGRWRPALTPQWMLSLLPVFAAMTAVGLAAESALVDALGRWLPEPSKALLAFGYGAVLAVVFFFVFRTERTWRHGVSFLAWMALATLNLAAIAISLSQDASWWTHGCLGE